MNRCFNEINPNIEEWNDFTGRNRWNAVYTVQLGELMDVGVFSWDSELLNWATAAYDANQYERVCKYFTERFYYREISIEPFEEWAHLLHSRLVYELMPKYRIQYAEAAREWHVASGGRETGNSTDTDRGKSDNYYKGRVIGSDYPETLLSGNSDYITDGRDTEDERIIENNRTRTNVSEKIKDVSTIDYVEAAESYSEFFGRIDKRLLDELETFFISMYTANVNATW